MPRESKDFEERSLKEQPPNWKPRGRGSREGDPNAEESSPGREFGAGGQVDDGPENTPGPPRH